jgi:hypothetical protein
MPQHAQLMGNRRLLHPDGGRELTHRARAVSQAAKDAQSARGPQGLHLLGDLNGQPRVEPRRV